ncbi:hypothetical protein C7D73_30000, partial [Klebsiella pneumoniae]
WQDYPAGRTLRQRNWPLLAQAIERGINAPRASSWRAAGRRAAGGTWRHGQPWRNLLAHCLAFVPDWQDYPAGRTLRQRNWPLLAQAIERGINAPRASS